MPALTANPAWQALLSHYAQIRGTHMRDLFAADAQRGTRFGIDAAGLYLDYSKQRITAETWRLLVALAHARDLPRWIARMFAGEPINNTEQRAVLHVALRAADPPQEVRDTLARMRAFSNALRAGDLEGADGRTITDVVHIGIGGSDLGPRMAVRALRTFCTTQPRVKFVANVDPADLDAALAGLEPATTLFIVASKTFTTAETLSNARRAKAWIAARVGADGVDRHFAAVSANVPEAQAFGVPAERIFPMWDWVGGRFSVWSAVGLPLMIAIGPDGFDEFLAGARTMDEHFRSAPLDANMPVALALLDLWYADFFGAQTHAVLPYAEDLALFPAHLQQLDMESNGKRVDRDGRAVDYATAPVLWGSVGTNGQHAFHQLLHQGTQLVPCDFIVAAQPAAGADARAHRMLIANALAQSAALMTGKDDAAAPHRCYPGNQPSSTIVLPRLTPHSLGALLALYEHKVFAQGAILGINSFDQWGVELGKTIAKTVEPALETGRLPADVDGSTRALIARLGPASN